MQNKIKIEIEKILKNWNIKENIEFTKSKNHADLSTNIAMKIFKKLNLNPMEVAEKIKSSLKLNFIEKIEIVKPGFINIFYKDFIFNSKVEEIIRFNEKYGEGLENKYINVEYVSANPTGHLHIGHARGAVLGSVLVNVLRKAGNKVDSEYYINDAGNQIKLLGESVKIRYLQFLNKSIDLPENSYKGKDIKEIAKELFKKYNEKLENKSIDYFANIAKNMLLEIIKQHLKKYNIEIDIYYSEQKMYDDKIIDLVLKDFKNKNYTYESANALWLKTKEKGDDKDRVLRKSDKTYTYFTPDIAYHYTKVSRGYDELINIWGADHIGYIKRMEIALGYLGLPKEKLDILTVQLVKLFKDNKELKMSKRLGTSFTMDELINEVGKDAARWFMIDRSNNSEFIFDIDNAKKQSSENPVFLVQYTNARTYQLLNKSNVEIKAIKYNKKEKEIITLLSQFPYLIQSISKNHKVHLLPQYLLDICNLFNSWYSNNKAIGNERESSLMALTKSVQIVISNSLRILDISSPKKM